ncbi:hypothetical protein KSX_11740 [Ktedonospora formicarum]|uniref:Uncharacterized protein n=1 Tax=Ktedonospora formicarum TaxID=2778364 RepID=A0A8J3HTJ4_9CHLR|nr:hypothetical protein KSX_11740 [Ktedonospora formicarum]
MCFALLLESSSRARLQQEVSNNGIDDNGLTSEKLELAWRKRFGELTRFFSDLFASLKRDEKDKKAAIKVAETAYVSDRRRLSSFYALYHTYCQAVPLSGI